MEHITPSQTTKRKLSLVHDFLIQMGGAERVVETVSLSYPDAPIYTSATIGENPFPVFKEREIHNSWMQKLPGMQKHHKKLFFLYPFAFNSLRMNENELAWISSSSFAKWIPKPKGSRFVCYCHTPPRYFWNADEYLENEIGNPVLRSFVRKLMPLFRMSDKKQSRKIDLFLANSRNVQDRIRECYGRDSLVVYPPVDVERFQCSDNSEDYFLIVSRLVSYKRVDLAVEAFTKANRKLVIVGDGPDRERLEKMAGPTVKFLGRASDAAVTEAMANCRGFVFPGCEDFGITPVEAQACGKPVLAYRAGGALETVREGVSGLFFDEQNEKSFREALERFDTVEWDRTLIRRNAERFSTARFVERTREILAAVDALPDGVEIEPATVEEMILEQTAERRLASGELVGTASR
ncbi:MAG: glycosyl transferase [Verrucomicrobiales bacterium]|nr:glycosyl transferase [Verrucomicrobiales bacterium]